MKKFAIVDCHKVNPVVEYVYSAPAADHSLFGGKWGDRTRCEHIELSIEAMALQEPLSTDLEIQTIEVQTGTTRVPDGDPQPALDENGDPIEDANGDPVMVQDYRDEPVLEMLKRAVPKV